MLASAISELGFSKKSGLLAAACVERIVQVWNVDERRKIGELATIFQSGNDLLAICPSGKRIFVGNSGTDTIAAYDTESGQQLWQRNTGRYPSHLRYSELGDYLWCGIGDRSQLERIDPATGNTLEIVKRIYRYWEGPVGQAVIERQHRESAYTLRTSGSEVKIDRLTFALLDVAFASDCLCLTESTGPVRCIESSDGRLRWRFDPNEGSHVLRLYYSGRSDSCYGVLWHYEEGLYRRLLRISIDTGDVEVVCDLDSLAEAFIPASDQLVTSEGHVIDLTTGQTIAQLDFPPKELAYASKINRKVGRKRKA